LVIPKIRGGRVGKAGDREKFTHEGKKTRQKGIQKRKETVD